MARQFSLIALFVFVLVASGCTVTRLYAIESGQLVTTDAATTPAGAQQAVIWTIDGLRVSGGREKFALPAGRHMVSVLPLQQDSLSATYEFGETAAERGITIRAIEIEVDANRETRLAAVVRRHRTFSGDIGANQQTAWRTTVLPLVVY